MKIIFKTFLMFLTVVSVKGQTPEIDYFEQTPPGDSAIVFAPENISLSGRYTQNGSFSPSGDEFCFTVTNSGWTNCNIYYTKFEDEAWLTPQIAEFISGTIWDPFFTPDSNYLIYSYAGNLWRLDNLSGEWGNPEKLDSPVSSGSPEFSPSVSLDGTIYYFSRRSTDIYRAISEDGLYTQSEKVPSPINDKDDREPFIADDESYLIFNSGNRTGGFGSGDLYISYNRNDVWTNPINLGSKINSSHDEFSPNVTPDGKYLLFTRRTSSNSKIYWVLTSFIDELMPLATNNFSKTDIELHIYPNPANNTINIEYDGSADQASYFLINPHGSVVMSGYLNNNNIDISAIPDGLYFLHVIIDDNQKVSKIIKI